MRNVFKQNSIDVVMHLAASKGMNSSICSPLDFYKNNISSLINLLQVMSEFEVKKLIFTSSCAVYGGGDQKKPPVDENVEISDLTSIYARTKYFGEEILRDSKIQVIILRVFNVIGAHSSGLLGEDPNKPQINILTLFAKKSLENSGHLSISSTCVRDFVHVMDIAEAHMAALEKIDKIDGSKVYNIGSGVGTSLLRLLKIFESISGLKVTYNLKECSNDEIKEIYTDTKLSEKELNWKSTRSIEEMCFDCWKYICNYYDI